jgi:5-methylcytosine-specific restriction endonuclease McrA
MNKCKLCGDNCPKANKFCGKKCYLDYVRRVPQCFKVGKGYIKPVDKCEECNRGFIKKSKLHRFCSKKCGKINWERRNPDSYKYSAFYKMRFEVFRKDGFRCVYCGRSPKEDAILQVEHIHPKSKGGDNDIKNYTTSCEECNVGKGDALLTEHEIEYVQKLAR